MKLTNGFDISASALTAQRLRMDVISSNIANAETTRASYVNGEFQPYKRKMVVLEPMKEGSFASMLQNEMGEASKGVKVSRIQEDRTPDKLVYNPSHPDADKNGYVKMPNVDVTKEMVDMISASRSYEANVTALNATKTMFVKALEIGK
ncbi:MULTISPECIES: flagellar basal body rod protein FlgC [Paenibacillus]|uniref:flagellar basal body rod protein FlgC n=1 Tax=Paenibacillus TaxID=44249 RepID=UPI00038F3A3A|nr:MULTISPECIES: flagellar basal body rod protein FlgC [Paenibacillus]ASS65722.1 flagellar basal body rod protein FlgC [Paenibacillus sp. RUD330]KKC46770.1 flagellar basal body rod protein FlgC [Paenibacillus sp. D9]CDN43582.1 Flagellar basal-body rod protein FlgC [Paenibacillus sp. P22]SIQ26301.1 flagellar basal-body rod protein FlgC [Paenibacillus sp. RU4X]SIQ48168.1 flagellar basal-body rod protein FlgC [Paenibacillus sp. RU4T]